MNFIFLKIQLEVFSLCAELCSQFPNQAKQLAKVQLGLWYTIVFLLVYNFLCIFIHDVHIII